MKQVFLMRAILINTAPHFIAPQAAWKETGNVNDYHRNTTTETQAQIYAGDTGTIRNLYVKLDTGGAPTSGKSWTLTVRKNGVDTAVVATIADANESGDSSSNSVAVEAGDKISIGVTNSGTPANVFCNFSLEIETATAGYSIISGGHSYNGAANYYGNFGYYYNKNTTSDSAIYNTPTPHDLTIRAIYVQLDVAPGAGSSKTLRIVTAAGNQDVVISGSETEGNVTGLSLALSQGDMNRIRVIETSGPVASILRYTVVCEANTDGYSWLNTTCNIYGTYDGYANFLQAGSSINGTAARKYYVGPEAFSIKNAYFHGTALAPGADKQITLNKNGVATALTFQVPQTATDGSNTTDEIALAEGDYIDLEIDHTGGGSTGDVGNISLSQYIPPGSPKGLPLLFAG